MFYRGAGILGRCPDVASGLGAVDIVISRAIRAFDLPDSSGGPPVRLAKDTVEFLMRTYLWVEIVHIPNGWQTSF